MSAARLITATVSSTVLLASSLMGLVARADAPIVVTGFSTPESALRDNVADVYLVSNINGSPAAFDNNGFISRVAPNGVILQLAWIRGGVGGVTLNAPKGMAIRDDTLYVSDIDTVRAFDRVTGAPLAAYAVPNPFTQPLFLNDVAVAPNGDVYASDNVNGAIFRIDRDGSVSLFASGPELGFPNGLVADGANNVSWVTWLSNQVRRTNPSGKVFVVDTIPAPDVSVLGLPDSALLLDGYLRLPDGSRIVSSWVTGAIYRISPSGHTVATITSVVGLLQNPSAPDGPADVGFDEARGRLLIPLFNRNQLVIFPLD
jgi:sugar lactone lactonase YvrE